MGVEEAEPAAAATAAGQPAADVEVAEEAVNFAAAQMSALRKADGKGKGMAEARTKKQGFDAAEAATRPMDEAEAATMIQAATRGHQTRVKTRLRIVQMEAQQWGNCEHCFLEIEELPDWASKKTGIKKHQEQELCPCPCGMKGAPKRLHVHCLRDWYKQNGQPQMCLFCGTPWGGQMALSLARMKVKRANGKGITTEIEHAQQELVELLESQGEYGEAMEQTQALLALHVKELGPSHPTSLADLCKLSKLLQKRGKFQEAMDVLDSAEKVAVKTHKPTGAALLPVYQEKGELFTKLKLLDQAFSYLDKAVDVCNRNHGPDDRRTATALVNVGKLHVLKGTFAESVFFYRSALRIRRQVLGPDHLDVAEVHELCSDAYDRAGSKVKAAVEIKAALTIASKNYGPDHLECQRLQKVFEVVTGVSAARALEESEKAKKEKEEKREREKKDPAFALQLAAQRAAAHTSGGGEGSGSTSSSAAPSAAATPRLPSNLSPSEAKSARIDAERKAAAARAEAEAKAAKARTLQEAVAARVVAEQRARMTQQTVASLRVEREAALQALRDKSAAEAQRAKDAAAEKEKAEWALQNAAMLRVKADTEAAAARDEASLQQAAAAAAAARLKARREEEAAAAAAAQLDAAERVKRRLAKQAADRARQHTEKLDAQVAAAKQEAEAAWESEERVRALSQTPQDRIHRVAREQYNREVNAQKTLKEQRKAQEEEATEARMAAERLRVKVLADAEAEREAELAEDERKRLEAAEAEAKASAAEAAVAKARADEAAAKAHAAEQAAEAKKKQDVRASVVLSFHPARLNTDDDDEVDDQGRRVNNFGCKVCLEDTNDSTSEEGLLVSPCACRGSLAMIHIGCLKQCHVAYKYPDNLACDTCHQPFYGGVAAELARMNVHHRRELPGNGRDKVAKVANAEVVLADLLTQAGQYNEALQLYQNALGVQVQLSGSQSFIVADLLHKVGEVFCIQGRYQDALLVKQQALAIHNNKAGSGAEAAPEERGRLCSSLGEVTQNLGNLAEAEKYHEEAMRILEAALGDEHPLVAACLLKSASMHHARGELEDAETLLTHVMELQKRVMGQGHPAVAEVATQLALVYSERDGRDPRALQMSESAMDILIKANLAEDNPTFLQCMGNHGIVLAARGDRVSAVERLQAAIDGLRAPAKAFADEQIWLWRFNDALKRL